MTFCFDKLGPGGGSGEGGVNLQATPPCDIIPKVDEERDFAAAECLL